MNTPSPPALSLKYTSPADERWSEYNKWVVILTPVDAREWRAFLTRNFCFLTNACHAFEFLSKVANGKCKGYDYRCHQILRDDLAKWNSWPEWRRANAFCALACFFQTGDGLVHAHDLIRGLGDASEIPENARDAHALLYKIVCEDMPAFYQRASEATRAPQDHERGEDARLPYESPADFRGRPFPLVYWGHPVVARGKSHPPSTSILAEFDEFAWLRANSPGLSALQAWVLATRRCLKCVGRHPTPAHNRMMTITRILGAVDKEEWDYIKGVREELTGVVKARTL